MDSFHYNFPNIDEVKSILTTANDNQVTTTTAKETLVSSPIGGSSNAQGSVFSPLAAPFQSRIAMPTQQEPRVAETAPSTADLDEVLMNMRINSSDSLFEERPTQNAPNYFLGNRAESVASTSRHTWTENSTPKNADIYDSFDFFLKTLSSANTYASMLTRDQLSVMQAIRPGLLYEFLKEVARVRSDRRMQRALPHECAFCKNNGENEENYSTHALKDWRGRVQCPVLRAFRCPRCGATGDRAHTIKYCPASDGLERATPLLRRRFSSSNPFVTGEGSRMSSYVPSSPTTTPVQSPSVTSTLSPSSFWSNFGVN